ncbi:MAG: hypothetical protein NUW01_07150 [Gemmatimonadaceae bacterium]|nr:hypothetical protein [Gemmatimonadaceae bacterium]
MTYAIDGSLGIDYTLTPTTADFTVGQTSRGSDGTIWMYVHANGAISQYDFVTIDQDGEAVPLVSGNAASGYRIGCAQVAFADNDYGWVVITALGGINGKIITGATAGTKLFATSLTTIAGQLHNLSTLGTYIRGVANVVTSATSVSTNPECIMAFTNIDGH